MKKMLRVCVSCNGVSCRFAFRRAEDSSCDVQPLQLRQLAAGPLSSVGGKIGNKKKRCRGDIANDDREAKTTSLTSGICQPERAKEVVWEQRRERGAVVSLDQT